MTDEDAPVEPTVQELRERHELEMGVFKTQLKEYGFDGPYPLSAAIGFFGGGSRQCAVCLECGAMIMLGDVMPGPDNSDFPGAPIERGIWLHVAWHNSSA